MSDIPKIELSKLLKVDTGLTEEQVQKFFSTTPKDKIKTRPAKGGGTWKYVEGSYVTLVLNSLFGFDWDFTVKTSVSEALQTASTGSVTVLGRLEVRVKGQTIVKEQFGTKEIAFKVNRRIDPVTKKEIKIPTEIPLNFGNDLKAAATDAKKKCASELGLFSDVYSQDNFFEAEIVQVGITATDIKKADPKVVRKEVEDAVAMAVEEALNQEDKIGE